MFSLNLIMSKHKDQSTLREILQSNWPWLLKKCLCNERQAKQKCKGHYKIKGNLKVITNAICYNSSMWQPTKLEKCVWIVYLCQLPNYCLLALTALLTLIWDTGAGSCAWTVNSFLLPAGVKWGFISRGLRGAYKQRGFPALFWFWLISPSSCTTGVSWSARNLQPSARFYPETVHAPVNLHQGSLLLGHLLNTAALFYNALPCFAGEQLLPQLTIMWVRSRIPTGCEYPLHLLFLHASDQDL